MKKFFEFLSKHALFILSLFLLIFIPLYPKIPLINVQNTWVYVRFEDFAVTFVLLYWSILFLRKKVSLDTPLTTPIFLYWLIGGIATFHGVLIIFPMLSNVFANVAFLSYLRRIEYISLFFVAYSSMKDKRYLPYLSIALGLVLLGVVGYGFGQKLFGFPAYLTMNEEFAKGVPLQLSELARVPSTFGGQYDLAAYLVLVVPLIISLAFGFKNWFGRIFLLICGIAGFGLLLLTVSRVSFIVLVLALLLLLVLQRKKLVIFLLLILAFLFLSLSPSLVKRFGNTLTEVNVLVNAKTGAAVGQVIEVPSTYFKDKIVTRQTVADNQKIASTSSLVMPQNLLPDIGALVIEPNSSNGETLPQGTSYVNLPLSPVVKKLNIYFYQKTQQGPDSNRVQAFLGDFVIKRAKAYDLSFTTRFQGEWPKTFLAFERNIFLGSGYGSVSLAVDNDYLRILGETGILGFASFLSIFLIAGIYARKVLSKVDSPLARSLVLGMIAGTFGLALNGVFIDVFEASKIAYVYWTLMGITLGTLSLYKIERLDFLREVKKAAVSPYAIIVYLLVLTWAIFSGSASNYFTGDDFTWFRWVASCDHCSPIATFAHYFTQSNGFFYRPGTKIYFSLMYSIFWLNQSMYHFVSIFLHFAVVLLVYFVSKKILKSNLLSFFSAALFLILSGSTEAIFWTSATGFLFHAVFSLLSVLLYIYWKETQKKAYLVGAIVGIVLSLLFHELGVVTPLLIILYDFVFYNDKFKMKKIYLTLLSPIIPYLGLRFIAGSHWFNGDYSYNILKLPFNFIGNSVGYFGLGLLGPTSLRFYEILRTLSKNHVALGIVVTLVILGVLFFAVKFIMRKIDANERKIALFGSLFFIISLLPFLGLGNITFRYSYLASFGFVLLAILLFKKIYEYLLDNGKQVALFIIFLLGIIFSSSHLFQLQKTASDWTNAGQKSMNFLISLDFIYAHYPESDTSRLFFVNIPIKNGDAWVFPVGLEDAAWFVFRNNDMKIYKESTLEQAFDDRGSGLGRVLIFNKNGSLTEMQRTTTGQIYPVNQ